MSLRRLTEELAKCPAHTFFTRLKQLCEEEEDCTLYLIDYSLHEALFFIAGQGEYLLLCIAFAEHKEKRYISEENMLTSNGCSKSPLKSLFKKKDKLKELCDKYGMSGSIIYLGAATEFTCLNPEEERQLWREKGINFIIEGVNIAQETGKEAKSYNKYSILSDYLSAIKL